MSASVKGIALVLLELVLFEQAPVTITRWPVLRVLPARRGLRAMAKGEQEDGLVSFDEDDAREDRAVGDQQLGALGRLCDLAKPEPRLPGMLDGLQPATIDGVYKDLADQLGDQPTREAGHASMIKLMMKPAPAAARPRLVDSLRATRTKYWPARDMKWMEGCMRIPFEAHTSSSFLSLTSAGSFAEHAPRQLKSFPTTGNF
jgi:hypothetical protein